MLLCDGCGDDISRLDRGECHIPLANRGGIDLCPDCSDTLSARVSVEQATAALSELADDLEARADSHQENAEGADNRMTRTCKAKADASRGAADRARRMAKKLEGDDE